MGFKNQDAARQLAGRLAPFRDRHPLVPGVPRGAVPMAQIITDGLPGDLDVVLVRKPRAPGQPELATAGTLLEGQYSDVAADEFVREEIRVQREILRKRRALYTRAHPVIDPAGRDVMVDALVAASVLRRTMKGNYMSHGTAR